MKQKSVIFENVFGLARVITTIANKRKLRGLFTKVVFVRKAAYLGGYRELVGGLLWPARNAYPAASFACSVLSRYMQTPTEEAFSAGIHTLHYLMEHRHEGIVFSSDGNLEPICFYDSAHMQDMSDHKSSYGFVITWMGGPIVYVSKRHTLVGLSSAEDEYMTLTHAYKWVMWLRK